MHERRISAAVQQQDALLAFGHAFLERALERFADHRAHGAFRRRELRISCRRAEVNDLDLRQRAAADAIGQRQQRVLAVLRVLPRLQTRRRAAEDADGTGLARAHDRNFARVIARRLSLFVRRLMLFIDDDRAEIIERGEHRRPRADGDALRPIAQREPGVVALAVAEGGMEHRDLIAEDGAESVDRLRCECDLRHEDDRALPLRDDVLQQFDVDERLAAAGDAVQERHRAGRGGGQRVDRRALGQCRRVVMRHRTEAIKKRIARQHFLVHAYNAALHDALHHGVGAAELIDQLLDARRATERLQ